MKLTKPSQNLSPESCTLKNNITLSLETVSVQISHISHADKVSSVTNTHVQRLRIPSIHGFELLVIEEITHLEADGCATHIYLLNGRRITAGRNLGCFEQMLTNNGFCRIHHRFLANLLCIRQYHHADRQITLSTGLSLPVAQQRMKNFLEAVEGISG